jgi:hypothetical protein
MNKPFPSVAKSFIIGRDRFAMISAVEGLALDAEAQALFETLDDSQMSADKRRQAIIAHFKAQNPA